MRNLVFRNAGRDHERRETRRVGGVTRKTNRKSISVDEPVQGAVNLPYMNVARCRSALRALSIRIEIAKVAAVEAGMMAKPCGIGGIFGYTVVIRGDDRDDFIRTVE